MSKYHKLVDEYKDEIEKIKTLKAKYDSLIEQAEAIQPVLHPEPDFEAIGRVWELDEKANVIYNEISVEIDELDQDIEAEYHDVPYAKPREAGVEGFWRESGLTAIFPRHHPRR